MSSKSGELDVGSVTCASSHWVWTLEIRDIAFDFIFTYPSA
jgi:hypothetical protein